MATSNAYKMEMNGAQKANKTTTMDHGNSTLRIRHVLSAAAFFHPLFSTFALLLSFFSGFFAFCTAGHAPKGRGVCPANKKMLRNCFDSCMNICGETGEERCTDAEFFKTIYLYFRQTFGRESV